MPEYPKDFWPEPFEANPFETFRQYLDRMKRNLRDEYPTATAEEIAYQLRAYEIPGTAWFHCIENAAMIGPLSRAVLDSYFRHHAHGERAISNFRGVREKGIPIGYILPSVRKRERIESAMRREALKAHRQSTRRRKTT